MVFASYCYGVKVVRLNFDSGSDIVKEIKSEQLAEQEW